MTTFEDNSIEQWCYCNMSHSNSSGNYIEEVKNEKIFLYEVTHDCRDVDLKITHGLSVARGFIPAVKISIIPFGDMGRTAISFDRCDWNEFIQNIEEIYVNKEVQILRNFLNFTITSLCIDGSIIIKINNFEGTLYLNGELICNILSYRTIIDCRFEMISYLNFAEYYKNIIAYISVNCNSDTPYLESIIKLCKLNNNIYTYFMLDYISIAGDQIVKDVYNCLVN